jgi:AcrR family transcriptional regulator
MPTASPSPAVVRRQPQQQRSRLLVAAIREACLRLLREEGPDAVSVQRIVDTAGIAVGSFYQYYPNKEAALVDLLVDQAPGEAERIAAETRYLHELREASLEDTVRQLVAVTCNRHSRLLALHGEVYRRHHRRLDFLALMQHSVARYVGTTSWEGWVLELLQRHPTSLDPQSLREAAFLVAGAIIELTARAVDLEPEWLSSATFQEQLVRLLLAYVQPAAGTANPNARTPEPPPCAH